MLEREIHDTRMDGVHTRMRAPYYTHTVRTNLLNPKTGCRRRREGTSEPLIIIITIIETRIGGARTQPQRNAPAKLALLLPDFSGSFGFRPTADSHVPVVVVFVVAAAAAAVVVGCCRPGRVLWLLRSPTTRPGRATAAARRFVFSSFSPPETLRSASWEPMGRRSAGVDIIPLRL